MKISEGYIIPSMSQKDFIPACSINVTLFYHIKIILVV